MGNPRFCRKFGKPLDNPVWEIDIPEPDHVLPISPSQNVPWAQWMDEIEDDCRMYTKPYPKQMDPYRFVLD